MLQIHEGRMLTFSVFKGQRKIVSCKTLFEQPTHRRKLLEDCSGFQAVARISVILFTMLAAFIVTHFFDLTTFKPFLWVMNVFTHTTKWNLCFD